MRSGTTLIEVLVAMIIFEFGMLAIVATSAVAARDLASANRRTRATAIARSRVEQLRSTACAMPAGGARALPGGLMETWAVQSVGARRDVSDSISFSLHGGRKTAVVVRAAVWCA